MNIKNTSKILSAITILCLSNVAIWCVQKSSVIASFNDINHTPTETECIANTKQIRNLMAVISENGTVSKSVLQELRVALDKNQEFFKKSEEHPNIRELLFGKEGYSDYDYDLFDMVKGVLLLNVKEKLDINSFAASVLLQTSLRNVIRNSVEWSEYLEETVKDLALSSPLTMVKYLDGCTQDEFDLFFKQVYLIYEIPGKRKYLDTELAKISATEKMHSETIEKIRNRMSKDCVEYFEGDEYNHCKD